MIRHNNECKGMGVIGLMLSSHRANNGTPAFERTQEVSAISCTGRNMMDLTGEASTASAQLRMPFHQAILSAAAKHRSESIYSVHSESRAGARSYRGPSVIPWSCAEERSYRIQEKFSGHAPGRIPAV
jgi:hypothetical protein